MAIYIENILLFETWQENQTENRIKIAIFKHKQIKKKKKKASQRDRRKEIMLTSLNYMYITLKAHITFNWDEKCEYLIWVLMYQIDTLIPELFVSEWM